MNRMALISTVVTAFAILVAGCSSPPDRSAPRATGVGSGGAGANVNSDDEFVRDVAMKNTAEIELSRMALTKAMRPDIKAFAQTMIDEHTAAGDKLKRVVAGQLIHWPDQIDDKQRKMVDELATKQGREFDEEYVEAMVDSHQNLAAKLESRLDVQSLAEWKTAAAGRTRSENLPGPTTALGGAQVRPNRADGDVTVKINQWAADLYPATQKHLDMARQLENDGRKPLVN